MPPYRQMVYLLLWQTAPRVVGDADPYNSRQGPGMPGPQLRGNNPFTGNHPPGSGMPPYGPYRAAKKERVLFCAHALFLCLNTS